MKVICSLVDLMSISMELHEDFIQFISKQIVSSAEAIGPNWPHRAVLADWLKERELSFNKFFIPRLSHAAIVGKLVGLICKGLDEIHRIVLDYASHQNENFRVIAPFALGIGWREDSQTLSILLNQAENDTDIMVRFAATTVLARYFHSDPQILNWLCERAIHDSEDSQT